ncbi:neugrin isoform X1 [Gouania willdenowi]|uniref:neugrin isoform X1 n=1 Tax=Gouania willdenowi TaxID=441366 RepID=UPI00105677C6|nr:neugrin-like isoform X1 [Gouania willdenowi]
MASSLLHRLSACLRLSLSSHGCVFNTRFSSGTWTGGPRRVQSFVQEDGDPQDQDVEEKVQAVVDEIKRKQKTVKFHILRRKMTPPGAPQRKLTWEAMEQIRFLKQDQPQEWSVHRLAESFSVHPDVIRRVLGSKFVPPPERKMKQNSKVMAFLRQNALPAGAAAHQPRETLPGNRAAATAVLQSGSTDGALVPVAPHQSQVTQGKGSGLVVKRVVPVTAVSARSTPAHGEDLKRANSAEEVVPSEEDEEVWDGRVFTEEELEELRGVENVTPPVQVGNEFFDSDGNLLYSI